MSLRPAPRLSLQAPVTHRSLAQHGLPAALRPEARQPWRPAGAAALGTLAGGALAGRRPSGGRRAAEKSGGEAVGVASVLRFVWPVTLTLLASTLQGLIDSSFVGRCGGALQLAALAPASSLVEGTSYLLSFIAVGTLNVLAVAGAEPGKADLPKLLSRSLAAALLVGTAASALLLLGLGPGVQLCGAQGAMVPLAASYAGIRALGMPLDLVFRVANAGLLAVKDSRTGLLAVLLQSAVNFVGDAIVCPHWGIAGAAGTTVVAQAIGAGLALYALWRRGLLKRLRFPPLAELASFIGTSLPICFTLLLKVGAVQFLNTAASSKGVVEAAAHQITKSTFWVFGLLASESLSATAQAFLPGPIKSGNRAVAARTLTLLLKLGAIGGALTVGLLALAIALGGLSIFSGDARVLHAVPAAALCLSVAATPMAIGLEGAHIAAQRQKWLSQRLLLLTATASLLFQFAPGGLTSLWLIFGIYLMARGAWFTWGLWGRGGVLASMQPLAAVQSS